ncbi:MAG TPA: hypothetical protein VF155_09165 [Candidatus Dormibacteraeota bacterium]
MPAIVEERTVRRISPLFFVVAIVCFFFTFASASCNTDAARTTLKGIQGIGGVTGGANSATIDRCVNAFQGLDIATYSGFSLVFGSAPQIVSNPADCPKNTITSLPGGGLLQSPNEVNLGVQPLEVAAFAAIALGLLVSEFGFFALLRAPLRGVLTTLLAVVGLVLLVVEQAHLQGAITDKISSVTAGTGAAFNTSSYFFVNSGAAYFTALGVLGAAALYNAVSAFFSTSGPEAEELPRPEMGLPPSRSPGLEPAGGWWRRSARGRSDR